MPRPADSHHKFIPALDGIRALAVLAVIAYHLAMPYSDGGLLGVAVFFTLSGFLITGLMLDEHSRAGRINLVRFWTRRFRRLLPALLAMLAVVMVTTAVAAPDDLPARSREALSAIVYLNNWWEIAQGSSYFDLFAQPQPFDHLWSLSIEEQFYVVWPLCVIVALWVARGRTWLLSLVTVLAIAASFAALWFLATPALDNTRAYEGTDTRVGGILLGALAAIIARKWPASGRPMSAAVAAVATAIGLVVTVTVTIASSDTGLGVYRWGILAISLSTALLAWGASRSTDPLARLLGSTPLRWIGERSYGLYLWHMPLVAFLPQDYFGYIGWCVIVVVSTFAISELSWILLEDPIRRNGLRASLPNRSQRPSAPAAMTPAAELRFLRQREAMKGNPTLRWQPTLALLSITTVAFIACVSPTASTQFGSDPLASAEPAGPQNTPISHGNAQGVTDQPPESAELPPSTDAVEGDALADPAANPALLTSCDAVVHLGDSTSVSLISESFLPDPYERIPEQYRRVGVREPRTEISGARSTVETYQGEPNSTQIAQQIMATGYQGCWVTAMGTNDAANVAVGSSVSHRERIDMTMATIGDAPTLWLTLKTENANNPYYAHPNMEALNQEIIQACERYPNMRVYDWASEVRSQWYTEDGIHFNTDGSRERSRRIADALAVAFPRDKPPIADCVFSLE